MKKINGFVQINENDLSGIIKPLEVKVWHFCMEIEGHESSSETVTNKIIEEVKNTISNIIYMAKIAEGPSIPNEECASTIQINNQTILVSSIPEDAWMCLLTNFSNQLLSSPKTIGEFIEEMKEKYVLDFKKP